MGRFDKLRAFFGLKPRGPNFQKILEDLVKGIKKEDYEKMHLGVFPVTDEKALHKKLDEMSIGSYQQAVKKIEDDQ